MFQQVLQGAPDPRHFARVQDELDQVRPFEPTSTRGMARLAAWLYARCRWQGMTLRSPDDCLVAACAVEAEQLLLHADEDFERIASIEPRLRLA